MHRSWLSALFPQVTLALICTLAATACKGSSTNTISTASNFNGTWRLDYDVLVDECGLAPEGANSFTDEQQISQTEDLIVLTSANLSNQEYLGEVRLDNSFEVATSDEGELFGDGVECTLTENLAYTETLENSTSSLYDLRLKCADGFYCVTALRGKGTRS